MEFEINLEGAKKTPKIKIEDGVYKAVINKFGTTFKSKKYNNQGMISKIPIVIEIVGQGVVMMYVNTKITKGSGSYSNSKLYDILEKAKLLEKLSEYFQKIKDNKEVSDEKKDGLVVEWLNNNLSGHSCEVLIKTSKSMDGVEYSAIDKIIKFLD